MSAGRVSAGLLPFTLAADEPMFFIAHMGGPHWAGKDEHAWSLVKGEFHPDEESPREAAAREWTEETGTPVPADSAAAAITAPASAADWACPSRR